jgi:ribosomal protein S18 acetylase RimI-like enzyme
MTENKQVEIVEGNLDDPMHAAAVVACVDAYARDPMGGGEPLPEAVKSKLVAGLKAHPGSLVLLAFCGREAVGIAVCFYGFSTFTAKPRLNVHDLAVLPGCRDQGIGRQLLEAVIETARARGCSGVTLEVRIDNERAKNLYRSLGFDDSPAPMAFWERKL